MTRLSNNSIDGDYLERQTPIACHANRTRVVLTPTGFLMILPDRVHIVKPKGQLTIMNGKQRAAELETLDDQGEF